MARSCLLYTSSLGLIVVSDKQEEYAALALFAITGVIAVLSLWLYEKEEKMWISALPSLCLFCIPLALDGVPEEWSIVGYGVSFLLLLCVGKRGTLDVYKRQPGGSTPIPGGSTPIPGGSTPIPGGSTPIPGGSIGGNAATNPGAKENQSIITGNQIDFNGEFAKTDVKTKRCV